MSDSYAIATWRFEQIAPLVDPSLDRATKRRVTRQRTSCAILWPDGKQRRIPRSTLHRWISAYRAHGYAGLLPKPRCDVGRNRCGEPAWIEYAIGLLYEQPNRSLTMLDVYLRSRFDDYALTRTTLARRLRAHAAYAGIEKLRGTRRTRLRDRYEAQHPHESWQLDGKGPFPVRLRGGERIAVHVLTVLDDHSRAVLAAVVANAEDTIAAITVFQAAALRHGLPDRMQFDRGSAFDSMAFRNGLALCGVHRNYVKARHPEAQGKIEAYHRSLQRWFIDELQVQEVLDLEHLQQLLDAMLALVYQRHHHRGIASTPEAKLAGRASTRTLSRADLERAFFVEHTAASDPKTGAIRLPNGEFRVPAAHAGQRCRCFYDPLRPRAVMATRDQRELELTRFETKPLPAPRAPATRRGAGQLQQLVDRFGRTERSNAEPAFGLPEVFAALSQLLARAMPAHEREAREVVAFWKQHGPIAQRPFVAALSQAHQALGGGRPLTTYLDFVVRLIAQGHQEAPSA
jgi:putative transposase